MENIGLGVITNNVTSLSPYIEFIANARQYGYQLSHLIIAYSHNLDKKILKKLQKHIRISLIRLDDNSDLREELLQRKIDSDTVDVLLNYDHLRKYGLLAYGKRRNSVLIKALLVEPRLDYLFFVDTDVRPEVLINHQGEMQSIDFFGRHLQYLTQENTVVTTSDYSGYYIIPPMKFDGLDLLLAGLQKKTAYQRVTGEEDNLYCCSPDRRDIRKTDKILGGNHALDLNLFSLIPPYYSTTYLFRGELILGRGEDTLMGKIIPALGGKIIDVDTLIFHDTFDNFPRRPDIFTQPIKERFYYAALGWIGRNPFLNWFLKQTGDLNETEVKRRKYLQKNALLKGSRRLAEYLDDERFLDLPAAFTAAHSQLEAMIDEYRKTRLAWKQLKESVLDWRLEDESLTG